MFIKQGLSVARVGLHVSKFLGYSLAVGASIANLALALFVAGLFVAQGLQWSKTGDWRCGPTLRDCLAKWLDWAIGPTERAPWSQIFELHAFVGIFALATVFLLIGRFGLYVADKTACRLMQKDRVQVYVYGRAR